MASPRRSSGGTDGSRDSGTKASVMPIATTPTGTSAQKTLCQVKCSSRKPPVIGPSATPMPTAAPQIPSAVARSRRSVNALAITDRVVGKISAALMPITTRSAMSAPTLSTSAAAPLLVANAASPRTRAGRRPNRSLRLPIASTRAAKARL